jgi:hypothetical protein
MKLSAASFMLLDPRRQSFKVAFLIPIRLQKYGDD